MSIFVPNSNACINNADGYSFQNQSKFHTLDVAACRDWAIPDFSTIQCYSPLSSAFLPSSLQDTEAFIWALDSEQAGDQIVYRDSGVYANDFAHTGDDRDQQPQRCFLAGSADYLSRYGDTFLSDVDFTTFIKIKPTAALGASSYGWSCGADRVGVMTRRIASSDHCIFYAVATGGLVIASSGIILSSGTTYDILTVHDKTTKTLKLSLNGSAFQTVVYTGVLNLVDSWFLVNGLSSNGSTLVGGTPTIGNIFNFQHWDGVLADVADLDAIKEFEWEKASRKCCLFCDEGSGTTSYDASGSGNDFVINAASINTWHNVTANTFFSRQNEVGYSESGGVLIPRDESDTANDVLGNPLDYTGQVPRSPRFINMPCGTFDGASDIVKCVGTDALIGNNMTFGGWFKINSSGGYNAGLITKGVNSQWGLVSQVYAPNPFRITFRSGAGGTDLNYDGTPADEWIHVVGTIDNTDGKLFLNGTEVASGTVNAPPAANADDVWVGKFNTVWPLDGQCALAAMWLSTLTPLQIQNWYQDGLVVGSPEIYISFTEQSGLTIHDVSGNGNDGTLTTASAATFHASKQDVYRHPYGARKVGSVYIPGRADGLAADGNALTEDPDKLWGGMQLDLEPVANAGVPTLIAASSPYEQGDGNNETDTVFGRVCDDGDDRVIGVDPAATGTDLTNIQNFVSNGTCS